MLSNPIYKPHDKTIACMFAVTAAIVYNLNHVRYLESSIGVKVSFIIDAIKPCIKRFIKLYTKRFFLKVTEAHTSISAGYTIKSQLNTCL